ncbi:MAG: hypothetical protein AB8G99_15770 [Planctomycetaceae bacterium]
MLRVVRPIACAAALLLIAGCSHYEGSRFNYDSGGLPFGGLTFAIGNDKSKDDIQIRRADGSTGSYAATGNDKSFFQRVPNALRNLHAPEPIEIPKGSERSLTDDFETELNQL